MIYYVVAFLDDGNNMMDVHVMNKSDNYYDYEWSWLSLWMIKIYNIKILHIYLLYAIKILFVCEL